MSLKNLDKGETQLITPSGKGKDSFPVNPPGTCPKQEGEAHLLLEELTSSKLRDQEQKEHPWGELEGERFKCKRELTRRVPHLALCPVRGVRLKRET